MRYLAIVAVTLLLAACPDNRTRTQRSPRRHSTPAKVDRSPSKRHGSHEHGHGGHPHARDAHHHHPHPHPHLDGIKGHHHPY